jgi:dTDP-4-amino-4,6-dideoxygalactose transaminase
MVKTNKDTLMNKIYLSSPHLGTEELNFVHHAFETNWIAPYGPNINGFEEDLQSYNKIGHAAALSSGTAAIHLALRLLDVKPGDYVLCQSFTFCGSANPILYMGAKPVFIDSEPDTWNMSPAHLREAIEDLYSQGIRPKACIPVHLYGTPAKIDEIVRLCDNFDIPIIEDAAESLGTTLHGQHTGTFGKLGIYSFNGNKIITTSGGGALVSEDEALIQKARFLATQARDPAPYYQHTEIGYNYRLSNVSAGIGRGQMRILDKRIAQRRANFQRYKAYFASWADEGYHIQFPSEPQGAFSNRWLTTILVDPKRNKGLTGETIRLALEKDNIEARPLWKPMHLQPVFEGALFYGDGTSERLFDIGLCLPSGTNMSEEDWGRIFRVLDKVKG